MFISVAKHQKFVFTDLVAGAVVSVLVARGVDTTRFKQGKLVVRLEDGTFVNGATADLQLIPCWPAEDIPLELMEDASAARICTVTVDNNTRKNSIKMSGAADLGPAVNVYIKATQGGTSTAAFVVAGSVGILGWEA
jgi:hypothetical protein